jgi:hypothetical protein
MGMMTHTLLLTWHMTGDQKYLEPIRSMAKVRLDYLESPPKEDPAPGSEAWCAARLGGMADVVAKHRFLTGSSEFDSLLAREKPSYMRYRMEDDRESLVKVLKDNAQALAINFPGYTSEVRYTDRVLRFPTLFESDGILGRAVSAIRSPNPSLLYSSITGDPGTPDYFPLNAVRWLTPPRDIAVLISGNSRKGLRAELFHFGSRERQMGAEFYLLEPGAYTLTLAVDDGGSAGPSHEQTFDVTGQRTRVTFALPPRRQCLLHVQRK